jgi:hypothetical protein
MRLSLKTMALIAACLATTNLAASDSLGGAFSADGWGARPLGMAGAFSAVADDANATSTNPAGMAFYKEKERQATFTHSNLYGVDGLMRDYVAYAQADEGAFGAFGLAWNRFAVNLDPEQYTEDSITYSGAKMLGGNSGGVQYAVGWTLKYLRVTSGFGESLDNTTVGGGNATGYGADLAVMFKPRESLAIAIVAQDVYSTLTWDSRTMEIVPTTGIAGVSYRFTHQFLLASEFRMNQTSGGFKPGSIHAGAEVWALDGKKMQWGFVRNIGFRGGYQQVLAAGEAGQADAGASVQAESWQLDYAFQYMLGAAGLGNSHRFGLGFRF